MKILRQKMRISFGLPSPCWLLRIGAVIIKTETELILKSRWVIPQKLMDAGYTFKFPTVDKALKNIFSK